MKVKILEREGNRLTLYLEGIPVVVANSLRRVCLTRVPVMAVESVFVYENNSVMNDQILAHRIGLIPLTTDIEGYRLRKECDCNSEHGCPKCSATLTLDAKAEDSYRLVLSRDIVSTDSSIVPVSPDIPIVKLAPGQRLVLEMRAIMGTGEEHVKWQPVSAAVVRGIPIFHVEEGKCDGCGLCIEECPKHIIKLDPKPIVTDLYACTTCMLCMRACPRGALLIDIDENSSIFMIESLGQLPPEKIVDQGLLQLTRSLDALDRLLDGLRMEGGEGGS